MASEKSNQSKFLNSLIELTSNRRSFNDEPIHIFPEYRTTTSSQRILIFDFLIKAGERKLCIIELKAQNNKNFDERINTDYFQLIDIRFIIITDGNKFIIRDRFQRRIQKVEGIENFIEIILKPISPETLSNIKNQVREIISIKVRKYFKANYALQDHIGSLTENIKLSRRWDLFFEGSKNDDQSFENIFFILLMNDGVTLTSIYRYTSFNSMFETIKNQTIRMNGLPGMNDTTEVNYVDNYVNDTELKLHEELPQTIAAVNRRFILCCSELEDDLLQWRLYGDDSMGACIEFKIDNDKLINRNSLGKREFYLAKVKYANKNGKHRELDCIKEIIETVRKKLHLDIRFTMLYIWKHFFKPYEYAYEKEVRLLYIERNKSKKKWGLTYTHKIINPFNEFALSGTVFPLKIEKVIMGSKLPEKDINKAQFKQLVSELGIKIKVDISSIKNYR